MAASVAVGFLGLNFAWLAAGTALFFFTQSFVVAHHPARMEDWMFTDYSARAIAGNRGLYTGSLFDRTGRMVASIAQEALYRKFS